MIADVYFTFDDEQRGYTKTREALRTYSDDQLMREYLEGVRAGFNAMFGNNARKFNKLVAEELLRRNITSIPNIFGPITVSAK